MYALNCVANLLQLSLFFKKLSKLHDAQTHSIMSSLLNIYQNFAHISKNIEFSKIVWKAKFYWNINMHAN